MVHDAGTYEGILTYHIDLPPPVAMTTKQSRPLLTFGRYMRGMDGDKKDNSAVGRLVKLLASSTWHVPGCKKKDVNINR